MKIGILTQPLQINYGGILQAYALQEVLRRMGHDVKTIDIRMFSTNKLTFRLLLSFFVSILKKYILRKDVAIKFRKGMTKEQYLIRSSNIRPFVEANISRTSSIYSLRLLDNIQNEEFDAIVVGSDQVWIPSFLPYYMLSFTEGWNIKRIAYAASFGHSNWRISQEKTVECIKCIKTFNAVSVREESGISLCEKYLGIEAQLVLDPTLLLNSSDYLKIIKPTVVSSDYIFSYILDTVSSKNKIAYELSKRMGCKLVSPIGEECGDDSIVRPAIDEWINGIANAQFVITDSFHGTVFSLIFHKQFAVMGNPQRGLTRIESILKLFGCEGRFLNDVEQISNVLDEKIDYGIVSKKIEELKQVSMDFLKDALN